MHASLIGRKMRYWPISSSTHFDGFSIGSNDMTQLTLGLEGTPVWSLQGFDERDPAVKYMLSAAITACKAHGKYVGIRGQGLRPPRPGRIAARAGHRIDVVEPRHRRRHVATSGGLLKRETAIGMQYVLRSLLDCSVSSGMSSR